MQMYNLNAAQSAGQISFILDCRESDSTGSWDDEEDIDYTEIAWSIRHSLNPLAWPTGFDQIVADSFSVIVSDSSGTVVSADV